MECLFLFIGRENCAIMKVVGKLSNSRVCCRITKDYPTEGTQGYLSADVDERHVFKRVLVSRRATTAALCH
jgi:hypothetical protein